MIRHSTILYRRSDIGRFDGKLGDDMVRTALSLQLSTGTAFGPLPRPADMLSTVFFARRFLKQARMPRERVLKYGTPKPREGLGGLESAMARCISSGAAAGGKVRSLSLETSA